MFPTQGFSCRIWEIFKSIYFEENLRTVTSETYSNLTKTTPFLITYSSVSNWYSCPNSLLTSIDTAIIRSSRPVVFCKKDFLTNFAKFTRKDLRYRLIFNEVAGLHSFTLSKKKRFWYRCFLVNSRKFLITFFLKNPSESFF